MRSYVLFLTLAASMAMVHPASANTVIVFSIDINSNASVIPQNSTLTGLAGLYVGAPINGQGVPVNGLTPVNGSGVPLNGAGVPTNGTGTPVDGNGIPVNGTGFNGVPDNGQPPNNLSIDGIPGTNGRAGIGIFPANPCLALGTCELFLKIGGAFNSSGQTLGFDAFAGDAAFPSTQPASAPIIPIGVLMPPNALGPGVPVEATGDIVGFDDPVVVGTWHITLSSVPEPSSALLLGTGILSLFSYLKRSAFIRGISVGRS